MPGGEELKSKLYGLTRTSLWREIRSSFAIRFQPHTRTWKWKFKWNQARVITALAMIKTRNHVAVTLAIIIVIQVDINVIWSTIIWCMVHSAVYNIRELGALSISVDKAKLTRSIFSPLARRNFHPPSLSDPLPSPFSFSLHPSFMFIRAQAGKVTFLWYFRNFDNNRRRKSSDISVTVA